MNNWRFISTALQFNQYKLGLSVIDQLSLKIWDLFSLLQMVKFYHFFQMKLHESNFFNCIFVHFISFLGKYQKCSQFLQFSC
jgi:hypothetical protein